MKKTLVFIMFSIAICLVSVPVSALTTERGIKYMEVKNTEYGNLLSLVGEEGYDVDSIVVSGPVGTEDFKSLRKLIKEGYLRCVNLKDASLEDNAVPNGAFTETRLQIIVLPESVESIGYSAFSFSPLHSINLPESLKAIGNSAFRSCSHLKIDITIPSNVTEIERNTFQNAKITSISLPAGIKSIGDWAFSQTNIKEITTPESVESIGFYAFADCYFLEKVALSKNVVEIGESAFQACFNLKTFTIEEGLKRIGSYAFLYDPLETITFPESIVIIEEGAFHDIETLKQIVCKATTPPLAVNMYVNGSIPEKFCAFGDGTPNDIPVYVPDESVEEYKITPGWDYFTNFLPLSAMSGVEEMEAGNVSISTIGNRIQISTDTKLIKVAIYALSGATICTKEIAGTYTSDPIPAGVYIVKAGNTSQKVALF